MSLNRGCIGRTFAYPESDAYEVSRELIRKFADAIGDPDPLYRDPAAARARGYADVLAPPTFLNLIPYARVNPFDSPEIGMHKSQGLHAEHRFIHHRPLRAGDRVVLRTTVAGIREAGAHEILDLTGEARTRDGELLSTIHHVALFRGESKGEPRRPPPPVPPSPMSFDEARYPTRRYLVQQLDLIRYAGAAGEYEPIHWSERAARAAGLPGVIAHGMFTMAKTAQALTSWFGNPGAVAEFGVRFARPLVVRELDPILLSIALTGLIREQGDLLRVHLDVRTGEEQILTKASALIRSH
jgi:acyl dehydratase